MLRLSEQSKRVPKDGGGGVGRKFVTGITGCTQRVLHGSNW